MTRHELVLGTVNSLLNLDLLLDGSQVILKGSGNYEHFATGGADPESDLSLLDENQNQGVAFVSDTLLGEALIVNQRLSSSLGKLVLVQRQLGL